MQLLQRLRRPEYTGVNRCRACTVVNVAALVVAVSLVALRSPPVAAGIGGLGAAVIWLRGYLLPFTPRFAPALVDPLPGEFFDHGAPADSDALADPDADDADPDAVLGALAEAGVVTPDGDRLTVSPSFETAWRERMDDLAAAPDDRLAATARETSSAVASARVERVGSDTLLVVTGTDGSTSWLHRPVAIAEVAAVAALRDADVLPALRAVAADALCAFLETCPDCGNDLVEGPLEDCCGHDLGEPGAEPPEGLACARCGVAFHRFE
ncbi:hypothetical protein [Halobellus ruber]|uniref:Uncharacterized protein n=1 Tax=Halobellus ruber TaxID=2761102 RepID=A0A7J9SNT5_9EURY|nr:hypothetical protein [Halobellus ruber]MBB6646881.1 hypothetical protein [Halobellus ruber]